MLRTTIAENYDISRIIKGGWQLDGDHGPVNRAQSLHDMAAYVEAGLTTFDCADIYAGVEALIGAFRSRYPSLARLVQIHTKFVPDLNRLSTLDAEQIERGIDRSLSRLGIERLDLVQLHWWDYTVPGYVEAALELARLREKGKIAHIGVTNFDLPRLGEIVAAGVPVVSMQGQFSLLDRRPTHGMLEFCGSRGIAFLCYGTVAGGFLSERWIARPAPQGELTNRSLIKYRLIIEEFGGWDLFQQLLLTLQRIAVKHRCQIATIASSVILNREHVSAVIVGATNATHLHAQRRIAELTLDPSDLRDIDAVLAKAPGPLGDLYTLERDRSGPHGQIMRYDLNQ